MIKKHRHLAGAAALIGLVSLPIASAHAGNGLDALSFLPQDTALVVSADVTRLGKSQAAGEMFTVLARDSEFEQMKTKLETGAGVNFARDVDTLVLAMAGDVDKKERLVFIAKGRFDAARITAFLKKDAKSMAAKKHLNTTYYLLDDDNEVAFIGNYMVTTPKGGMVGVLDVHNGKAASVNKNAGFMSLVKRAQHKNSLWIALDLPASMRKEIAAAADGHSIDSAIIGIDITKSVDLSMTMVASSKKAATALASKFRDAGTEMAKDPSLAMMGLADAFKRMSVKHTGTAIDVAMSISAASVQQLLLVFKSVL